MTTTETETRTTEVFRVYIKASPEAIWQAITSEEWNGRYGYHAAAAVRPEAGREVRVLRHRRDEGVLAGHARRHRRR